MPPYSLTLMCLPMLIKHFRNRYADQKWIIYDVKRGYGLHYDLHDTAIYLHGIFCRA